MQSPGIHGGGLETSSGRFDSRLPPIVVEKQTRLVNKFQSATNALTGQMENCIGLLKGHSATLYHCNEIIEGALLTLGVPTTHLLLSSIKSVIEGLETVAKTCKVMCDSHFEEMRQREDVFCSLSNMYLVLKERHEATERELRTIVAERDFNNAAFNKAVAYVEAVVAERAVWQERNGYNCVGLPLVDRSFSEMCHEALDMFDNISNGLRVECDGDRDHTVFCADTPTGVVRRWEALEDMQHKTAIPSARLQYIPPRDEVNLLREVLEMGTVSRVLLSDVHKERENFEEAKKKFCGMAVKTLDALRRARSDMQEFKKWFTGVERTRHSFNAYLGMIRGALLELEKKMLPKSTDDGTETSFV